MSLLTNIILRSYPALLRRNFHASNSLQSNELKKLIFRSANFYKFGLLEDDLVNEYDEDVAEALRRLPEDVLMQRKYRAIRAMQTELNNSILPNDQWTKFEDDHHYLQPYIEEVKREREEREEWEATH